MRGNHIEMWSARAKQRKGNGTHLVGLERHLDPHLARHGLVLVRTESETIHDAQVRSRKGKGGAYAGAKWDQRITVVRA